MLCISALVSLEGANLTCLLTEFKARQDNYDECLTLCVDQAMDFYLMVPAWKGIILSYQRNNYHRYKS